MTRRLGRWPVAAALILLFASGDAHAYIGPGAGFALGGSMLVLLVTFTLAFAIILTWPIRLAYRLITVGNPYKKALAKRVVAAFHDEVFSPRVSLSRADINSLDGTNLVGRQALDEALQGD